MLLSPYEYYARCLHKAATDADTDTVGLTDVLISASIQVLLLTVIVHMQCIVIVNFVDIYMRYTCIL